MGYNSGVIILNDALGDIEANPLQFTERVVRSIKSAGAFLKAPIDIPVGCHCNAASLFHMAHADDHIPYLVGGNYARKMNCDPLFYRSYRDPATVDLELLKALADKMGYRISKKPANKV